MQKTSNNDFRTSSNQVKSGITDEGLLLWRDAMSVLRSFIREHFFNF